MTLKEMDLIAIAMDDPNYKFKTVGTPLILRYNSHGDTTKVYHTNDIQSAIKDFRMTTYSIQYGTHQGYRGLI